MSAAKVRQYWLMKSEPNDFSIADLERVGREPWDGVRNYQARNFMRDEMRIGDEVLFYHSNAKPSGIAGLARVCSEAIPDYTAWDPENKHFDERSTPENPVWMMVNVEFVEAFDRVIPLSELKQDSKLSEMLVCRRGMRLSIQPVEPDHFHHVVKLAKQH